MHAVLAHLTPNNPWFWILTTVGSAVVLALLAAVGGWLWLAIRDRASSQLKKLVKDTNKNATEAKETAQAAADRAVELKTAVGEPNGHGDLVTMVTSLLTNQLTVLDRLSALDSQVKEVRTHLGLS